MLILRILLFISSIVCLIKADLTLIFLLPSGLFFFSLLDYLKFNNIRKSFVYKTFYFQAIIRYTIIPLILTLNTQTSTLNKHNNYYFAIIIMLIELFFIALLFLNQNKKCQNNIVTKNIKFISNNIWLYIISLVMIIIIINSGYLQKINFIWNLDTYVKNVIVEGENMEYSNIGGIIFYPFRVIILLLIFSLIFKSKFKLIFKYILVFITLATFSSLIIGVSRFSILTFTIPFYFLIISISKKKFIKTTNIVFLSILIPIITVSSLSKFTRGEKIATINTIFDFESLNAYFSGIENISIGIESINNKPNANNLLFLVNDLFKNVPLFSKFTNSELTSSRYFNQAIYGHLDWGDQIIPLSISGMYHFNIFGIGLYVILFMSIAFYFEKKALSEEYLPYKYVYFSLMFSFSLVFMINFSSFFAFYARTMFFIIVPFFISNKLNKTKI